MPRLFAVAQRPDAPNRSLTCDTARNWQSLVATKQGGFKMEVRAPPTLCTDLTHRIAHVISLHAHAPRLSAFPPTHRINVVCAAEQTANGSLSKLFSNPETRCTVRSLCFAELPRCWDRAGPGPRFSQPTLETTFVNNRETGQRKRVYSMLYTIAVVLVILWLLGLVTSYTMGGFVHILLVVAIVMILVNLISGRRAL